MSLTKNILRWRAKGWSPEALADAFQVPLPWVRHVVQEYSLSTADHFVAAREEETDGR